MEKYSFFDHTGDLGLNIFGKTLPALFRHAGEAITQIITDVKTVQLRETKIISLRADRIEDLMVHWLNELIFLFDAQCLLFAVFDVTSIDSLHLEATVKGEAYDQARHPVKTTIKSATYHQLEVVREAEYWKARVIVDL